MLPIQPKLPPQALDRLLRRLLRGAELPRLLDLEAALAVQAVDDACLVAEAELTFPALKLRRALEAALGLAPHVVQDALQRAEHVHARSSLLLRGVGPSLLKKHIFKFTIP